MAPDALYDLFRSDVVDAELPYLWSDDEVYEYMDDAYSMFVRLIGGIPDATSALTTLTITATEAYSDISPKILKIRQAILQSNHYPLTLLNVEDTPVRHVDDYGVSTSNGSDYLPGPVRCMVIGEQEDQVRWVNVPVFNDTVKLVVFRLPLNTITDASPPTAFNEVQPQHHRNFLMWMKYRAYGKQDAETFDRGRSADYKVQFEKYCQFVKGELARQRSKTRIVAYGGL